MGNNSSWFRAFLSGLFGILIGIVCVAVANMMSPFANLEQVLILVCLPAFLSGFFGNVLGSRQKTKAA